MSLRRAPLSCLMLVLVLLQPGALADEPTSEAVKARIESIMSAPPFTVERVRYEWRYRGGDDTEESDAGAWVELITAVSKFFGTVSEVLLWAALVVLLVLVIVYRERWMPLVRRREPRAATRLPTSLFGLEETEEPLPEDVPAAAWALWQRGEHRACLSLLYRGALLALINEQRVDLPDSATEEDCLLAVSAAEPGDLAGYFQVLTRRWQRLAYARRAPDEQEARRLCEDWPRFFGASSP